MATPTVPPAGSIITVPLRFRLFIDFWNFQILLNNKEVALTGNKFKIDWQKLPAALVRKAASVVSAPNYTYDGTIIFTSYDAKTDEGKTFHRWIRNWLDKQPGVQVQCFERRPKSCPKCQACHKPVEECPHCKAKLAGTVEKGVDTAIATDMIRLAWEKAYDVGERCMNPIFIS